MDNFSHRESEKKICLRCGHVSDFKVFRCAECGAPLDEFASSSPWEMGAAKDVSSSTPVEGRTRPIVFWGVWLYFGPSAIAALWFTGSNLYAVITDGGIRGNLPSLFVLMLIGLLYGGAGLWALWSVSAGLFRKKQKKREG